MKLPNLLLVLTLLPTFEATGISSRQTPNIVYQQFVIDSVIVARYSTIRISSVVRNDADISQELSFRVQLPETAFISNFTMTVNGRTYHGVANEKARAAQEFQDRLQAGENVGLVEARGTNLFSIHINTAARSQATFVLQYEELIVRKRSKFQQIINLNPGSKVENFNVTIRAVDEQGITFTNASSYVGIHRVSSQEVIFSYSPSLLEQVDTSNGLARDMFVEYDVNRPSASDRSAGLFIVNDCYFAQFFSPSGVERVPVDIIFVIDVSGSMSGTKIDQTRVALETIINQLAPGDRFSMVTFQNVVNKWKNTLVSVSEYRQEGIQFARGLAAGGGTNFNGGVITGADILNANASVDHVQLLVVLTDGRPTAGERTPDQIVMNARTALTNTRISLNCLGFGLNLNFELLERLALANNGIVRRIYEGSDAASQLEGFFEEISQPILSNIVIGYPTSSVETISNTDFPLLFNGSELVVAGKFSVDSCGSSQTVPFTVTGSGASNQLTFESQIEANGETEIVGLRPSTERLAAYLSIQQLLEKVAITTDTSESAAIEQEALAMSLRYNFVTELTSLIVVEERGDNFTLGGDGGGGMGGQELDLGTNFRPSAIPPRSGIAAIGGALVTKASTLLLVISFICLSIL